MAQEAKPPYRVPSMAEVAAVEPCGLAVASAFAGGGGSSLGYRMAGYRVVWACEFVPAAAETYRANMAPGTVLEARDVREVKAEEVLAALGMAEGELDVLDGSPPCDPFSTSGRQARGWGKAKNYAGGAVVQRTDDLFPEYVRLVDGLRPRVFVAENVAGLARGVSKGYLIRVVAGLRGLGYRVEARLLDAQWLGVPQARARVIIAGVREDLGRAPAFPAPLPYRYSIAEALEGVPTGGPAPIPLPPSYRREWRNRRVKGAPVRVFNLRRDRDSQPSSTVVAAGTGASATVTHPHECRKYTIPELRRLGGFPDDYVLTGDFGEQWQRIGQSVPPVMMRHIAAALRDRVLLA